MANERISMRKMRDIIRLREKGLGYRQIGRALRISHPVVSQYARDFAATGLSYEQIKGISDSDLMELLAGGRTADARYGELGAWFERCTRELKRVGVTIQQIWEEYRQEQPDGYSYSQFCYHFQVWRDGDEVTMHIEHKVGDKLFVDFAGKKLTVSERHSGGRREVESFVAVLGASQLGYLQVVETQQKADLIAASAGALDYIGGVPAAIVPDCLKSAVTKADPYEPDLNRAYAAFARHYGMVVLPARSGKPKDKALVEQTVRLMYQRVYAKLRDRTFYSIDELNAAIGPLLDKHNATRFQRLPYSRRELFDRIERAALQPLPAERFELMQTLDLKVQFNYHIELREDRHYYSVPWRLKGTRVQVLYNDRMVEIYHDHLRVAAHRRARTAGGYTTVTDHMPPQHRFYADWSPERILRWAGEIGPEVAALVGKVLDEREHPEQGFKVALGIINLHRKYGEERLQRACGRALEFGYHSYRAVKNILANGLDKIEPEQLSANQPSLPLHANIRGNDYYHSKEEH